MKIIISNHKVFFKSIKTNKLTKKQIQSICKLKNSFWLWKIKEQVAWFKKHTKKFDIHNMLISNNLLIGYTLLRKRNARVNKKIITYFYFDTLIIEKKYRNIGCAKILMLHNNRIISKNNKHSFLICNRKLISFYKKFNWKVIKNNRFKIMDHVPFYFNKKQPLIGMVYKLNKKNTNKIDYYLN